MNLPFCDFNTSNDRRTAYSVTKINVTCHGGAGMPDFGRPEEDDSDDDELLDLEPANDNKEEERKE